MHLRVVALVGISLAALFFTACGGTKEGIRQSNMVRDDAKRMQRIPNHSTPDVAEAAMGRKPDAVHKDGDREIHYYVIRGAVNGETLRLVYLNNELIGQSIENSGGQ